MHFDRRFLIIVGCSLLWGLVVAVLFYRMASGTHSSAGEKTLIVATVPLSPGATITAEAVKQVRVPDNLFPRGGYSKAEDVVGRPVVSSVQPDEPLVESRLAAKGSGFGVAPMIPPGMRAASVRVNDVAGVSGFVLPGMRVDVLVTGRPPGADDTYTATVLQNVTVLSAGQSVETDGKSQSMNVPVVTLLVSLAQAESLMLAANEGHIQLVLRNSTDQQVAETHGSQLRELYKHGIPVPAIAAVPPPALPRPRPVVARVSVPLTPVPAVALALPVPEVDTVVLIHGNQKTIETFPRSRDNARN